MSERKYVVKIGCNNLIRIVEVDNTNDIFPECYKIIDCEWIEVIDNLSFGNDYIMLIDEEGKLKDSRRNMIATMLYGNPYDYVAGNAVIVKNNYTPEGDECIYLTAQEACYVLEQLKR